MAYGSIKANTITTETGVVNVADFVTNDATPSSRGIMTAADKTKLDGVEDNATADQTGAEIKAAYEAEADTNAFDDAAVTKLAGIEAGATTDQTGAEIKALYEAEADTNAFDDAAVAKLAGIEASATADQTGAEIKSLYEAEADTNAFTDAEQTKLAGIAAGATNVTNNNQLTNGAGYITSADGGNAATLDGIDSASFLRSDADDSASGTVTFNGRVNIRGHIDLSDNEFLYFGSGDDVELFCNGSHMYMDLNSGIGNFYIRDGSTTRYTFDDNGSFTATGNVTAYSDINLKENIEVISNALDKVSEIRGVTYDRKDLEGSRHAGVIAQEVEAVLPEVVMTNEEGVKSVAYGNLVGLLVEAVKELKAEVETLKQERN